MATVIYAFTFLTTCSDLCFPPLSFEKHSDRAPCRQPVGGLHEHNVGRTRAREQGEYEPAHRARSRAQRAFSWKSVNSWRQSDVKPARTKANDNRMGADIVSLQIKRV